MTLSLMPLSDEAKPSAGRTRPELRCKLLLLDEYCIRLLCKSNIYPKLFYGIR